ncbi:dienelactone hydrolase family protein [Ilumatobacter nonamiensis]|uniref:dienelactone hydrolase family protein n=1 Tax=Ilumatobacter nonamiensis TaxID=467093 RepID=UPI0003485B8A|nr:dienelactone hydrolase family protein [Ilumatobacter nonamiensis]
MSDDAELTGWERDEFTSAGITHDTYRKGSGPGVVIIHEIPGITPKVLEFAEEVVDRGFTVVMPDLMGTPGKQPSTPYLLRSIAKLCVAREFTLLATNQTSPVIAWLRAVARDLHSDVGGPGVGAVGMCFSGGFALGMMVDEIMLAPVLSQPSLPVALGAERSADLNLSPDDEATVIQRAQDGCQVLGLRFTDDRAVGTRFTTLKDKLGDAFIAIELPSDSKSDHSVLTEQRDDASVERVLDFFVEKLQA